MSRRLATTTHTEGVIDARPLLASPASPAAIHSTSLPQSLSLASQCPAAVRLFVPTPTARSESRARVVPPVQSARAAAGLHPTLYTSYYQQRTGEGGQCKYTKQY